MPSPIAVPAGSAATAIPLTRLSCAAAASRMRGAPAAGPATSASTAPASTEASWPGSPTSTSRAPGRTASTSRTISESETIEASSTITTSCGSALRRGARPSRRWTVERREAEEVRADRVADGQPFGLVVHGLGEPCGRLAGRRGERDERRRVAAGLGLLGEQGDDPRDRRGLPRARTAGHDRDAAQHRGRGRQALIAALGQQPVEPGTEQRLVDHRRRRLGQRAQAARDPLLLAPVAVEVDDAAVDVQRPARERARRDARRPSRRAPATAAR